MAQENSLGSRERQAVANFSALQRSIDLLGIEPHYHGTVNHDHRGGHEAKFS